MSSLAAKKPLRFGPGLQDVGRGRQRLLAVPVGGGGLDDVELAVDRLGEALEARPAGDVAGDAADQGHLPAVGELLEYLLARHLARVDVVGAHVGGELHPRGLRGLGVNWTVDVHDWLVLLADLDQRLDQVGAADGID
jgi:hypothetical protein